jgi:hypothetical protein
VNALEQIDERLQPLFVSQVGDLPPFLQTKESRRVWMSEFEEMIRATPGSEENGTTTCPLKHTFADGMYARTGFMPAGSFVAGKIHRYETINILHCGSMAVITEDGGLEFYAAPHIFRSPAGCRKSLFIMEDCYFTNVNRNRSGTQDMDQLESELIVTDLKELSIEKECEVCG